MEDLERKKIQSDIVTSWIGLIGVLGALLFGAIQYLDSKDKSLSDKKKASLSYAESYDSTEMYEARKAVDLIVIPVLALANKEAQKAASPAQAEQINSKVISETMTGAIESNEKYKSVQVILSFFDRAWNCVKLDLCDADALAGLLREKAYSLNTMFGSYIEHRQETNPEFGIGISNILAHNPL